MILENFVKVFLYYYIFNKEDVIGSFVNFIIDWFVVDYMKKIKVFEKWIDDYKNIMVEVNFRLEDVINRLNEMM